MKTTLKVLILALLALLVPALSLAQQNTLVQTTTSAAITISASQIRIASATSITAPTLNSTGTINQQGQWGLYVDREFMAIVGINGTAVNVTRGQSGTVASPHASGAMVLYGRLNWFYVNDPGGVPAGGGGGVGGVSCTSSTVYVTPYLNIRTGAQWLCSSITSIYVAGFNNTLAAVSPSVSTALVITNAQLTPTGPLFHATTNNAAVTGWLIPVGCDATVVGGCSFSIIPDTVFTWTATNNIAVAGTAVINRVLTWYWDATNSKWVPSYV